MFRADRYCTECYNLINYPAYPCDCSQIQQKHYSTVCCDTDNVVIVNPKKYKH